MSPLYVPDSDKYSSLVQPLLMVVADYIAILLAETGALTVRLILLDIFDLPHGHFRLTADYFLLWIPAIF